MNAERYVEAVRNAATVERRGRVTRSSGLLIEARGPAAFLGEVCEIPMGTGRPPVRGEVVGLQSNRTLLMCYGDLGGVRLGDWVIATGCPLRLQVGDQLLGRVIDPFGVALDGKAQPSGGEGWDLRPEPINPLARQPIEQVLETGVRAVDTLLTIGKGQRVCIFAGSGVGKSTLLGMIARNVTAEVNVIALIGERGREVPEFVQRTLGETGLRRSVVVVATSDQPALVRRQAAYAAIGIAEYFRARRRDVLLIMDSLTRFAMAQREIGLAAGEPPTARGYTPSVFALLPKLLERCGAIRDGGTITAIATVLTEGDDLDDPVADHIRAIVDGNIVLSRELANRGHFPAIDVLRSVSRLMPSLVQAPERELAREVVRIKSVLARNQDMVGLGAYQAGGNPELDQALKLGPQLDRILEQSMDKADTRAAAVAALAKVLGRTMPGGAK